MGQETLDLHRVFPCGWPPVLLVICTWNCSRSILTLLGSEKDLVVGPLEADTSLRNLCWGDWTLSPLDGHPQQQGEARKLRCVRWRPRAKASSPSKTRAHQPEGLGLGPPQLCSHRPKVNSPPSLPTSVSVSVPLSVSVSLSPFPLSLQSLSCETNTRLFLIEELSILTFLNSGHKCSRPFPFFQGRDSF